MKNSTINYVINITLINHFFYNKDKGDTKW